MSVFTDLTTLRHHLQAYDFDTIQVNTLPVVLEGSAAVQLPHNALAASGLTVYTRTANTPTGPFLLTLTGTSWHSTGMDAFLPGSVVVAADDLPRDLFVEGVDFAVDDDAATIKRLSGGAISDGQGVYAWVLDLVALVEDEDYSVDRDTGQLARVPGGALPDPARVLITYSTTPARASEALLSQAIDEAEGFILARLKEGYDSESTDDGIVNGSTELALAYVCDDLAGAVLARDGDSTVDDRSRRYQELARRYEERALRNLSPFLRMPPPMPSSRQRNQHPPAAGW